MADIDDLLGPSGSSQPELRSHDFPWYQGIPHRVADLFNVTSPAGMEWVRKLTGTQNPLNVPGNIHEGYDKAAQGYRNGDPHEMLQGAVQAGLAALPVAGPALSATARMARGLRTPAPAPRGPWNMTASEFENAVPSRVQPEGQPVVDRYAGKPAQWKIDDAARDMDMATAAAEKFLDARYPGRVANADHRLDGLDDALAKFARNNEHVPNLSRAAEDHLARVKETDTRFYDGVQQRGKEDAAWDKALGEFAGPAGHELYFKEAMRRDVPTLLTSGNPKENPFQFTDILKKNYGADPNVPGSIERAYQRFWADEDKAKAAGQPTWHDIAYQRHGKVDAETEMADVMSKIKQLDSDISALEAEHKTPASIELAKKIGTGVAGGAAGMGAAEAIRRGLDSQALEDLLSRYNPRGPR